MKEKTIIFINNQIEYGGIETLIYRKSKWLIENGYKVYLITFGGLLERQLLDCGVNIIKTDIITSDYKLIEIINLYNKIVSFIDISNIEVIECFNPNESFIGLLLSKMFQCKLLVGEYHPKAFIKGYFGNEDLKKTIQLYDKYDSLIYMNTDTLNSHKNYYNINLKNNILKLALDIKQKRNYINRQEEFIVLSVGRLVDFKKYVYGLVNDFNRFYNLYKNVKLIIIGDGTEKSALIKYTKAFQSYKNGKIHFLGTVPYDKLDQYIYRASMVIGMGTSILEMASAGIPAIVAPAYAEDNISNGFIFEDDNIGDKKNSCTKTYLDYMELLYNCSDDEYKQISEQCRQVVVNNYSIDNIMKQWLSKVSNCKPIILNEPLDMFSDRTPLQTFLTASKRKLKYKFKKDKVY